MSFFLAYRGLIGSLFEVPVCLTWVRGNDVDGIVRAFGGRPDQISEGPYEEVYEAYEMAADEGVVLISPVEDWIMTVELTRYRGAGRDTLRSLSAGGEALALAWTGELDAAFTYAVAGRLDVSFDPVRQMTDAYEAEYVEWSSRYGITRAQWQEDWRAAAFTIAETITGVSVDQAWKDGPHLVLRIEDADDDPDEKPPLKLRAPQQELLSGHPRVAALAGALPVEEFSEGTVMVAQLALGAAEPWEQRERSLLDEAQAAIAAGRRGATVHALQAALNVVADQFAERATQVMPAGVDLDHLDPDPGAEWGRLLIKHNAVKTLISAFAEDPYEGVTLAIRHARVATAPTRKQTDDYRLVGLLETLAFYVFKGYSP
ncbi:DUF6461 domain-containing protein [Nonomuraea sp. NPDC050394]|uniref:DUF6461 domain-containing protein n=1 Tax=Nonomuraea sp. NPDC050394 TaxID=3364363 RepID=UPI0037B4E285